MTQTLESLSLHIAPLLVVVALAVVATLPMQHSGRAPRAAYVAASQVSASPRTPYGSSAAVRALLF